MKKEELIFDQKYEGALTVSKVSKVYGDETPFIALNDVSVQFFTGEFVVILGASGSGKSTLLNLIGGMDKVSSGEIKYANVDITTLKEKTIAKYRKEVVGFVFQFYNLMPNLTALENVEIAELPYGIKAIDALKQVGIEDKQFKFPSEMSGGEQQRVSIARAIVKNPKILLCDEPTGAVDFENGQKIVSLLLNLNKKKDKIIIVATHNEELTKYADRVIVLSDGKIVSDIIQKNPEKLGEEI